MKRWLSICVFWLSQLVLMAQAGTGGADGGFDPETPPNPDMPRPKYELTLNASPQQGGSVYRSGTAKYEAGSKVWQEAYANNSFVFVRWAENGETVSTDPYFYYVMPERNVTLTAEFRFDPTTPPDPQVPKVKRVLTLESQPAQAGSFNWGNYSEHVEGEAVRVVAYTANSSFKFLEWQQDGKTVSKNSYYSITMPNRNVHLVALYEFNPAPPKNPGTNFFSSATGEVIVTDFEPGDLYSALYALVGDNYDKVKMITVVGRTTDNDWSALRNYYSCTMLDLSRTDNMTVVPDWAFENFESLEEIILPASIQQIGWYAFYGCSSLRSISIYATMPPTVSGDAFNGVPEGLTVYVPALSQGSYRDAEGWKMFNILPLGEQVSNLTVNMPKGANMALYKDMYVELFNLQNGQRQRYLIDVNKTSYEFSNLIHNTQYHVYLKNAQGMVLGQIENVSVEKEDVEVTFESLLVPRDVTLKVLATGGTDVTEQVTITWLDENGTFLTRGGRLPLQLEGAKVRYRIALPQALGQQYLIPVENEHVVGEANDLTYSLTSIPVKVISGKVTDLQTGESLAGATITISQVVNGLYSVSYTVQTAANGTWSKEVQEAKTEVTASKANYVSQSRTFDAVPVEPVTFALKDINGTKLFLHLTYTDVNGQTKEGYADSMNVAYTLYNVTTGQAITEMNVQYSQIVLMDHLAKGTRVRVTATSKKQEFMPVEAVAEVEENETANVTIAIQQLGAIRASYGSTDNTSVVGILYDKDGRLIQKYDYVEGALTISELTDGNYTLVTMAGSQFFNSVFSLGQFAEQGLYEGIDYVKNACVVSSAKITTVSNAVVPFLDESKLYYTSNKTSFTLNKSQTTVGQFLTLSAYLDFKSAYAGKVEDVKLVVDLPQAASFVASSVMIGNSTASYTVNGSSVVIPVANLSERIRFCITPTAGGTYSPAASVQFTVDGKTVIQPIGSVTYTAKDLSLTVPAVVSNVKVPVSGSAVGKSTVKVYVDNVLAGQTIALANGIWTTTIELVEPEQLSVHAVHAVTTTPEGVEMLSETQLVTYDETVVQVSDVVMYYTNPEENWWTGKNYELKHDFLNPLMSPLRYTYYIYNRSFTFAINFTDENPEKLQKVILEVKTGDGRWNPLTATYNDKKKTWLAYGEFGNMYDGIVPVNVRVRYVCGGGEFLVYYPGPDADVPIDPSGYVYEAVPSNRVEGVTASIYYKETVEDIYGDKHENVVLWDAEEYAQENPLFTDENGMYRWDVPQGLWQVKFEKEGYQTTYSEWLPVPPPQLDVNIAITQPSQPQVKKVAAYDGGVEVEFDKYMDPATLTLENIQLTRNGNPVEVTVELLNEEAIGEGKAQTYASKLALNVKEGDELSFSDEILLTLSNKVKSYAGVPLDNYTNSELGVAPKVRSIVADETVIVAYDEQLTLKVAAVPAVASVGKKLYVKSLSSMIAEVVTTEVTLDENGEAEVTVSGELPGATVLTFTMDDTDVTGHTTVTVKDKELLKTIAPRASRVSGTQVYRGTQIFLTCETANAEIRYTLDGSDPLDAENKSVMVYDETPIVITDDNVVIKAVAQGMDMSMSDVAVFKYGLKKTTVGYNLPEGWSWISHNLDDVVPVSDLNLQFEQIVGKSGALEYANAKLDPVVAYKVKVAAQSEARLNGVEFNAAANAIQLTPGWNWIGYPVNQVMRLSEALAFYEASEGDMIVGQDGFSQYAQGEWKGTLETLNPGKGYLFKSVEKNQILFNTAIVSNAVNAVRKRSAKQDSWAVNRYAYPDIMPLTAQVLQNDEPVDADDFVVAAFCDDECRGVGVWNEGRLLMNIYGNLADEISFKACKLSENKYYTISEDYLLQTTNLGSWAYPIMLSLGSTVTGIKETGDAFVVTPIVARDYISVSAGGQNINTLSVTNMGGQSLLVQTDLGKMATIAIGQLPEGVYVVTVKTDNQTYYKKITKTIK